MEWGLQMHLYQAISALCMVFVDGITQTHGDHRPRQHIWTFAATDNVSKCPCSGGNLAPPEVGSDYFCDVGVVWDGNCQTPDPCCSFNNPPWFYKQLPQSTTDGIEMRVCTNEQRNEEDVWIQLVEIYVQ
jgi:hypothetical protein